MKRREFLSTSSKALAGALITNTGERKPNILFVLVDQMQTPPEGYGPDEGMAPGLKEILGFRDLSANNPYTRFFPGMLRLRQNAVLMGKHHTASAACVPSRTCILTGQYPNVTGVDQTDGMFKNAADVPFLDPGGTPTIGDWFRAAGYTTHYFGKWHVSDAGPETNYLEPWGFSDWESSYPEPHGGTAANSATFRDVAFAGRVVDFLRAKGTDTSGVPWLAVASLVNPHDCSIFPMNWQTPMGTGVVPWSAYPPPPSIPAKGQRSIVGTVAPGTRHQQTYQVDLNPDGFPQQNSGLPRTYTESLAAKPRCQRDYALKLGFAFGSISDYALIAAGAPMRSPHPFQLQGVYAPAWALGYNQFYAYCHYLLDLQMRRILDALDDSGLRDNTIIVLLSDHGDMTSAHGGMIHKWHVAYEEAIRVPMLVSSPLVNPDKDHIRKITQPTSSIDLAPTLFGLAGITAEKAHFPGADLSSLIKGETTAAITGPDGKPRNGVFFMTNDRITELGATATPVTKGQFNLFRSYVDTAARFTYLAKESQGPVTQPNNLRAYCTGDWKIVRYVDPRGIEPDEWEIYCLATDPIEQTNLVNFRTGEVRNDVAVAGMTADELRRKAAQLKAELARQEAAASKA